MFPRYTLRSSQFLQILLVLAVQVGDEGFLVMSPAVRAVGEHVGGV
jgi:hypothetical protein